MLEKEQAKGIIEALLFATARIIKITELQSILEMTEDQIKLQQMDLKLYLLMTDIN